MKQKDIALIILIGAVSAAISFATSHFLFATPGNQHQSVATVSPITTDFSNPDQQFFNNQSIDPAKLIEVGSGNNTNPFNGSGQ